MIINIATPLTILLLTALTVMILMLGKETKKSIFCGILLIVFLGFLVMHAVQYMTMDANSQDLLKTLSSCLTVDFVLVFLSFLSYLWVDDMDARENNKKSIDNSLDWFWKKV